MGNCASQLASEMLFAHPFNNTLTPKKLKVMGSAITGVCMSVNFIVYATFSIAVQLHHSERMPQLMLS